MIPSNADIFSTAEPTALPGAEDAVEAEDLAEVHPAVPPVAVLLLLLLLLLPLLATHPQNSPRAVSPGKQESRKPPEWKWRKRRFRGRVWPRWLRNLPIIRDELTLFALSQAALYGFTSRLDPLVAWACSCCCTNGQGSSTTSSASLRHIVPPWRWASEDGFFFAMLLISSNHQAEHGLACRVESCKIPNAFLRRRPAPLGQFLYVGCFILTLTNQVKKMFEIE